MGSNGTEKPSVESGFNDHQHHSARKQVDLNTNRHEHPLVRREGVEHYICSGCKEYGAAKAFVCGHEECNSFTLHEECATMANTFHHPLLDKEGQFTFRPKTNLRRHCQACGDVMRGFMFESGGMRLHPYCMKLPTSLNYSRHPAHRLELSVESTSSADKCTVCGERIKGWMYTCRESSCKVMVKVDMSCAKVDFHGLGENATGKASPDGVSKMIKRGVKLVASQMGNILRVGEAAGAVIPVGEAAGAITTGEAVDAITTGEAAGAVITGGVAVDTSCCCSGGSCDEEEEEEEVVEEEDGGGGGPN